MYQALPKWAAIFLANTIARLRQKKIRFSAQVPGSSQGLFSCAEGDLTHYFADLPRGLIFYSNGVQWRSEMLAGQYFLDQIETRQDQWMIDVGANYGDLGRFALSRSLKYLPIEPGIPESFSLMANFPDLEVIEEAVGAREEDVEFYVSSGLGDSSLIQPKVGDVSVRTLRTRTLDSIVETFIPEDQMDLIVKIEAEGAEPEVLQGAERTVSRAKYVAIEGGRERQGENTLSFCANFLSERGFIMLFVNPPSRPGVALFSRP